MVRMNAKTPRQLLTPAALHILLTLAREPMHGYGVKQAVEERTGGRFSLGPGTLYEAIHRMSADGWLEEIGSEGPKRMYRITTEGRRVLNEELQRLGEIVDFARAADLLEGNV